MKSDGTAVVEEIMDDATQIVVNKIDDMLEEHSGIRDLELSQTFYDMAKSAGDVDGFAAAIDDSAELTDFHFPEDFILDVYELVEG